jgi:hypothetical protein
MRERRFTGCWAVCKGRLGGLKGESGMGFSVFFVTCRLIFNLRLVRCTVG